MLQGNTKVFMIFTSRLAEKVKVEYKRRWDRMKVQFFQLTQLSFLFKRQSTRYSIAQHTSSKRIVFWKTKIREKKQKKIYITNRSVRRVRLFASCDVPFRMQYVIAVVFLRLRNFSPRHLGQVNLRRWIALSYLSDVKRNNAFHIKLVH